MAKFQKLSDTHIRVICDCGKYFHELSRDPETGDTRFESFPVTPDAAETKKQKPKKFVGFWEIDDKESE